MERLDKVISSQTNYSRKDIKDLVKKKNILVNGEVVFKSDIKVDVSSDKIFILGEELIFKKYVYLMLNKPKGYVSATEDKNDKTVLDLVPDEYRHRNLFPAGRLDKDTTGLMIITDDGDFAHRILSPSRHVDKTYIAEVSEKIDFEKARQSFKNGVILADGTVLLSAELELISDDDKQIFKVVIKEGKYHQVKRMFASLGTTVTELKRISIGGLDLDESLMPGEARLITSEELLKIFNS